jgi:hypothetical protein
MDASPTALFDSYEQDFKQLVQSIDAKLSEGKDAGGGQLYTLSSRNMYLLLTHLSQRTGRQPCVE